MVVTDKKDLPIDVLVKGSNLPILVCTVIGVELIFAFKYICDNVKEDISDNVKEDKNKSNALE